MVTEYRRERSTTPTIGVFLLSVAAGSLIPVPTQQVAERPSVVVAERSESTHPPEVRLVSHDSALLADALRRSAEVLVRSQREAPAEVVEALARDRWELFIRT